MKKNICFALTALIVAVLMSSCASYQKTAPIISMADNRINTYVEADLDYAGAKKVEGVVETKTFLGIPLIRNGNKTLKSTSRYGRLNKRESQALYRAKESSGVDIILEPEFETEKHSYFFGAFKRSKTTVTGWGLNIKGIKEDKH
jgi:hypothetical protein